MATPVHAKLNRLLSIRTRLIEDVEHHIEEIFKFDEKSNKTLISYRTTALEKALKDLVEICEALEDLTQYHALENVTDIKTKNRQIQDQYLMAKCHLVDFVDNDSDRMLNSTFFQNRKPVRTIDDEDIGSNCSRQSMGIKFQKIKMPDFDGKYEDWPEFNKMFTVLMKKIHGDDIERHSHLKNALTGEARDVIKHLNNYDTAWELLIAQYENKHAIVDAYLLSLFELPDITNAATIRQAITTTNSALAGIKNLDIMIDTWDPMIVFTLRAKLSPDLRQKWEEERKGSYEVTTLKQFLDFLQIRFKISAATPTNDKFQRSIGNDAEPQTPKLIKEVGQPNIYGDAIDETATYHIEKCLVCSNEHRTFICPEMKNPVEALRTAKEKKLCINCLQGNHGTAQCISRHSCNKCQKRHHTIFHEAFIGMEFPQKDERSLHTTTKTAKTILATALVPIFTQNDIVTLRALIDQGSTSNLISERGAQLIQCLRREISFTPIHGLDNTQTSTSTHQTVFIIGSFYNDEYEAAINAYIIQNITTIKPIPLESFAKWSHLHDLNLADPTEDDDQIDLLIGSQTFAKIIEQGLIKGKLNEPIAQETALGWILSGGSNASKSDVNDDDSILINLNLQQNNNE